MNRISHRLGVLARWLLNSEWLLLFWSALVLVLILAVFADIYVLITDAYEAITNWLS